MGFGVTETAVQVSLGAILLHVTFLPTTVTGTVDVGVFPWSCREMCLIGPTIVVVVSLVFLLVLVTAGGAGPWWT